MLVQPAGAAETIFRRLAELTGPPTKEELDKIHEGTGVTVLGEPLRVEGKNSGTHLAETGGAHRTHLS